MIKVHYVQQMPKTLWQISWILFQAQKLNNLRPAKVYLTTAKLIVV